MTVKIGKRIKALRKKNDVTQDKLAEVLGVTSQAISKWENETGYPDIEYMIPIANFFNVTIDELFGHDSAEKERKINEYCKHYDDMHRAWKPVDERIDIMRQALAEYPGEEKLLVRLAEALWDKWCESNFDRYSFINGKCVYDFAKCRARAGWEEPVRIMEGLLATSVDDTIRSKCRDVLVRIYGAIGEKEKVYQLAEYCPACRERTLFAAFSGIYDEEARVSSQSIMFLGLSLLRWHLPRQTNDLDLKNEALEKISDLYKFIFSDGNCGFYHAEIEGISLDLVRNLLWQDKVDEAFEVLENAYLHAKQFDVYLDMLRSNGEVRYTSEFADVTKDISEDVYASKAVPNLLNITLLNEADIYYKKLNGDPRFASLIERIKSELSEN